MYYYTSMDPQLSCDSRPFASVPQLSCDFRPFASVPQLFNKLSRKSDPHQNIIAQIIQFLPPRRAHTVLEATLFLQKFPETRNRNRYLFSGKISETRAQGKLILYLHELIHQLIPTFDHVLAANTDSMFCISS